MKADTTEFSFPDEAIQARAAAWWALRDGGWTEAEQGRFAQWLDEDPRHAESFRRLEMTWRRLNGLKQLRPENSFAPDPDLLAPISSRSERAQPARMLCFPAPAWLFSVGVTAAAFMIAFLTFAAPKLAPARSGDAYETPLGGFARVTLTDGSVMEMNADTAVRVAFEKSERRVFLERGEAHFTVARDVRRPFWVESDRFAVRAVGTAFDVRRSSQGIEVLVTAGRVKLAGLQGEKNTRTDLSQDILGAGWRAILMSQQRGGPRLQKLSGPQMRSLLSWQSSRLSFVEMPLGEVVEEFNERNEVQIQIGDSDLANLSVGGSFAADNVDSFIRLFTSNGDIVAERATPGVIVLRHAR